MTITESINSVMPKIIMNSNEQNVAFLSLMKDMFPDKHDEIRATDLHTHLYENNFPFFIDTMVHDCLTMGVKYEDDNYLEDAIDNTEYIWSQYPIDRVELSKYIVDEIRNHMKQEEVCCE